MNRDPFDLTGRNVLVVGGGTGIGLATAFAAARAGARVLVAGRRGEVLEEAAETARGQGLTVEHHVVDVSDLCSVRALLRASLARFGTVDGLVNAAGVAEAGRSEDVGEEHLQRVLGVNLLGATWLSQEVGRTMLARGRGSVVHIGSTAGQAGIPGRLAYNVSKHGVNGLVRTLAAEWGPSGVRVNALCPGVVRTPILDAAVDANRLDEQALLAHTPLRFLAEPEHIAGPAVFLLSDAAAYITGQCLVADGGWTATLGMPNDLDSVRGQ